jgi:hypothetical protein
MMWHRLVMVVSLFGAHVRGTLALAAATEPKWDAADPNSCYPATHRLADNETLQSQIRQCIDLCPYDCTTNYNSTCAIFDEYDSVTAEPTHFDDAYATYPTSCEQELGGLFVVQDAHVYCGDGLVFHRLNYPYYLASTCDPKEMNHVIEQVYFPISQKTQGYGQHCVISRKAQPWREWAPMVLRVGRGIMFLYFVWNGYRCWRKYGPEDGYYENISTMELVENKRSQPSCRLPMESGITPIGRP